MDDKCETEFSSVEETEKEFNAILNAVQDEIEADERNVTILNALRMKQFQFCYATILYLTRGTDVLVSYKLYEPFKTMGSIHIEGEAIAFQDMVRFAHAAEFASNIEVYPLAKDKVRMTFTFHNLTVPIG